MNRSRQQNDASAFPIYYALYDSVDHVTGYTGGGTPTILISKNGGAFAAATGTTTAATGGTGEYIYTPSAADLNTLGELCIRATLAGADTWRGSIDVVPWDQFAFDPVTMSDDIGRILSLVHENSVFEPTRDGNGDVTGGVIYCYDTAGHATTNDHSTGLIYKYTMTNTLNGSGKITVSKVVRTT